MRIKRLRNDIPLSEEKEIARPTGYVTEFRITYNDSHATRNPCRGKSVTTRLATIVYIVGRGPAPTTPLPSPKNDTDISIGISDEQRSWLRKNTSSQEDVHNLHFLMPFA